MVPVNNYSPARANAQARAQNTQQTPHPRAIIPLGGHARQPPIEGAVVKTDGECVNGVVLLQEVLGFH